MGRFTKINAAIAGASLLAGAGIAQAGNTRASQQPVGYAAGYTAPYTHQVGGLPNEYLTMVGLIDSEMVSLVAPMVSISCFSAQAGCVLPLKAKPKPVPVPPPVTGGGAGAGVATGAAAGGGLGGILPFVGLAALAGGIAAIASDGNNNNQSNGAN